MLDTLYNPDYWHWLILACVFFGLEIIAPGVFFLWLGMAAVMSGAVKFIFPDLGWGIQYLLFAIFGLLSLLAWKRFSSKNALQNTDHPNLNMRNQSYLGRTVVLSQAIENGYGKVRFEDSQWKVTGNDAPVGTKVKVVKVDGSILHVELA